MQPQAAASYPTAKVVGGCIAIVFWLAILVGSDAYYAAYLFTGAIAAALLIRGRKKRVDLTRGQWVGIGVLTALLSLMVLAANYSLIGNILDSQPPGSPAAFGALVAVAFFIVATIAVFLMVAYYGYGLFARLTTPKGEGGRTAQRGSHAAPGAHAAISQPMHQAGAPWKWFVLCWVSLMVVYLAVFFLAFYPGVLSFDSIQQVKQVFEEQYSNNHPFYHTLLIQLFMNIGLALFGDVNAAVSVYSVFQCIAMSAIFAFCIETMAAAGAKRWMVIAAFAAFLVLPYHWVYATTMWKDVLFGGFVLLFACSLYRLRKSVGGTALSATLLFVSSLGFCLFRSNGLVAFAITAVVVVIVVLVGRRDPSRFGHGPLACAELCVALCVSLVLTGPMLSVLNVLPTERIEALSIPVQQVARVVVDHGSKLTEDEKEAIGKVMDVFQVQYEYVPYISDPVKNLIRDTPGSTEALDGEPGELARLYLGLGLKYPESYTAAWIDQTRGYWNSGYPYWVFGIGVKENALGIEHAPGSDDVLQGVRAIRQFMMDEGNRYNPLAILYCNGFWVWMLICLATFNLMSRRRGFLEAVPIFAILGTLLIATPVFAEFRYFYSLYTCLPFLLFTMTRPLGRRAGANDRIGASFCTAT